MRKTKSKVKKWKRKAMKASTSQTTKKNWTRKSKLCSNSNRWQMRTSRSVKTKSKVKKKMVSTRVKSRKKTMTTTLWTTRWTMMTKTTKPTWASKVWSSRSRLSLRTRGCKRTSTRRISRTSMMRRRWRFQMDLMVLHRSMKTVT